MTNKQHKLNKTKKRSLNAIKIISINNKSHEETSAGKKNIISKRSNKTIRNTLQQKVPITKIQNNNSSPAQPAGSRNTSLVTDSENSVHCILSSKSLIRASYKTIYSMLMDLNGINEKIGKSVGVFIAFCFSCSSGNRWNPFWMAGMNNQWGTDCSMNTSEFSPNPSVVHHMCTAWLHQNNILFD